MRSVACKNGNSAFCFFLIISLYSYFNSFQEHNSAAVKNISMILCGFIEQVNAECHTHLHFSNYPPPPLIHIFNSFSEHNSAAVRNILMKLGRITEKVSAKCDMQE